jgi:hypothetical protein
VRRRTRTGMTPGKMGGVVPATVVLLVVLVGCTQPPTEPTPAPTSATATPTPTVPPTLQPGLGAEANLPWFDHVNRQVIAANSSAGGRDFIDALVAAGFDKAAMQVTHDRTTIDLEADSIQFSVLFEGECLIGQYGAASEGYHSAIRPALGTGGCLVGSTRPVDW